MNKRKKERKEKPLEERLKEVLEIGRQLRGLGIAVPPSVSKDMTAFVKEGYTTSQSVWIPHADRWLQYSLSHTVPSVAVLRVVKKAVEN